MPSGKAATPVLPLPAKPNKEESKNLVDGEDVSEAFPRCIEVKSVTSTRTRLRGPCELARVRFHMSDVIMPETPNMTVSRREKDNDLPPSK